MFRDNDGCSFGANQMLSLNCYLNPNPWEGSRNFIIARYVFPLRTVNAEIKPDKHKFFTIFSITYQYEIARANPEHVSRA